MWNKNKTQVLVSGAGPAGLTAGICLYDQGIEFEIVDKASGPSSHSKACLLSPETLGFLDGLDLLDDVLEKGLPIKNIQLYTGGQRIANLGLSDLPNEYPFILSIPQSDLEAILLERLKQHHKTVHWNHRISSLKQKDGEITVEVDRLGEHMTGYAVMHEEQFVKKTISFNPQVVLAADGFHSLIRRLQKIEYEPVGANMSSLLFETKRNPQEDPVLKLSFTREGTAAYVPLPHGFGRFGFTTGSIKEVSADRDSEHDIYSEDLEKFPKLNDAHLEELLEERMPCLKERIKQIVWRASVPFGAQLADRFWNEGIFLLGDAARSGFPIGAKSLNYALPEAGKVAKTLKDYLIDRNDSELEKLADSIHEEWVELALMSRFPSKGDDATDKDLGLILQSLPLTGKDMLHVASKLSKSIASHSMI